MKAESSFAKASQSCHVMTDKQNRTAAFCNIVHFTQAFFLKLSVSHRKNLIHNQNLRLQMRCHGKGKSHIHSRGITLYWCIQKPLYFCKSHNFVKLHFD